MTRRDELVERLRRLKVRLTVGGTLTRTLVPLVEVCEFSVSHGFREVIIRARLRLGRPAPAPAPRYAIPRDDGRPFSPLVIPPATTITTSIVVPVLNNAAFTHRCLRSIVEQTPSATYEVIVVDNGSDDATREMLSRIDGLRLIRNDSNVGFVGACNQGAAVANGDFILFLNNDTIVLAGWLDALLGTLELDPSCGAVGTKLIYPDGRLQEAGSIIWRDGTGWNYGRHGDPEAPEFNYVREVDYCSGACLLVRRSLFERLGGFDARYAPAYYEDTDLCFRLREHGYRVLYQPRAVVVHFEGATAGTDVSTGLKSYQQLNHRKFAERHAAALLTQSPHDPQLVRMARNRRPGKRILLMDHMVPHHDQDSGSVRMMALLRILTDLGHRVTFLPDNLARIEPYTTELQQLGIEVVYGPISPVGFVKAHCDEFDVAILCRAHFATKYIAALRSAARRPFIIFDTVDLHYLREQRLALLKNDSALASAAERTRAVEEGVMRASDMVWVTSGYEADLLRQSPGIPAVEVVPNIHVVRADTPPFNARKNILFIGGFRHAPNEDAVLHFAEAILPLVKSALPDVQFLVIGSHMPRSILGLASRDVVILGHVPDVKPIFDGCRASVAPLRYGAGVKGKITQSLAWGLPVVATPVAAEGMQMVDGEHLLVASDPADFARRLVAVYRDEELWTRLSSNGRRHIEAHLGYESVRQGVGAMLDTIPSGRN